jgi:uncharacterized membrane protein YeaQ/YmgE (transglycosylase-associated protein family)
MESEAHGLLAMPGVGFFGMLIIGILAGYIAEKVTASDQGLLTNLLVGIAGSFVGGSLANLLDIHYQGWLGQSHRRLDRRRAPALGLAPAQRHDITDEVSILSW